ncbi:hypothetical protein C7212DRAFT_318275 [Tuber magnatum]|uniref:Uncharacterized protein n=1 Tax=Tuber magnatum TaxID=42249 RepID=A0A317SRB5_9PEZI|nr:hypothetical protein C7212DRAFT_318274 [Tuber magnatum]PWW77025.1 hypothetical protein C7212DRAFT_318275 [Tuber magnatum]
MTPQKALDCGMIRAHSTSTILVLYRIYRYCTRTILISTRELPAVSISTVALTPT